MIGLLARCGRGLRLLAILSLVVAFLQFVVPLYMMSIYNRVLQTGSMETLQFITLIAGGLLLVMGIAEAGRSRLLAMMATRLSAYLNHDVYQAVLAGPSSVLTAALNVGEVPGGQTSELSARQQAITDLRLVTSFVSSGAINTFFDALLAPIFLAALFLLHPLLGWIGIGAAGFILSLAVAAEFFARASNRQIGAAEGRAQSKIERSVEQFDAVASMGIAPNLYNRWEKDRQEAERLTLKSQSLVGAVGGIARAARLVVQVAVLGVGAWLALTTDGFLAGAIIAASIILTRALTPVDQSIAVWQRFVRARASAARLLKIVDAIDALPEHSPVPPSAPLLSLKSITLSFPAQNVPMLQDAGITVKGGQVLGVLGPVGSGKTTLLRAMAGLHKPQSGTILLGETPVERFPDKDRQRDFGYLPQDIQLLPGTIAENISRFTTDLEDMEAVFSAAEIVGVSGFIEALPDGFGTLCRAETLSAGQRQLLGLARALYTDPLLALLDEPTSNLDEASRLKVSAAITARREAGKMTVLISHDPSVLNVADHLLYLSPGTAKYGATAEILRYLGHQSKPATIPDASTTVAQKK